MSVTPAPDSRCPCGTGETYAHCCGRFHSGAGSAELSEGAAPPAPTAEALMRSRYSAYAVGGSAGVGYLLATWHPSTRPAGLELDPATRWRRLEVLRTTAGGPFDEEGTVDFAAHYTEVDEDAGTAPSGGRGRRGVMREHSRFVREGGRWYYVDGDVAGP
ncbi:YchJ family protein [Sinomonas halotolerans]|uniref:UPF0225 protein ABCQ75_05480 n=1 Tax=Sinomonas halotolerans TaxID=1644133 RepID=A0ABU9WZG5_9MICC